METIKKVEEKGDRKIAFFIVKILKTLLTKVYLWLCTSNSQIKKCNLLF